MLPAAEKPDQQEQIPSSVTNSWFWKPHTVTGLCIFVAALAYFALFETSSEDTALNTKRGLFFASVSFIYIAMVHCKNGPFIRPHPIFWRLVLSLSMLYELILIFVLFQRADDVRGLLVHIDPALGAPLQEMDYSSDCKIYDPAVPSNPYHNVWDKMDWFVIFHLTGWWAKAIVFRDYWMSFVLSISFEILEYSLEHQLPNFAECWWDHWILDAIVCNGLGIWLGIKTLDVLESKTYDWRDLWNIPGKRGKFQRILSQFTPYSWTKFDWGYTEDIRRWFGVIGICCAVMMTELNTFYLKAVLWIPPPHVVNYSRAGLLLFMGAVCMRETYEYMSNRACKRFGQQSWVALLILTTESMIVFKFGYETITTPFPSHVIVFWGCFVTITLGWSFWNFTYKLPRRKRTSSGREVSVSWDEVDECKKVE